MLTHLIEDGDRHIELRGEVIGSSTSYADGKRRWAEITIYRSLAGQYVVAGVGRSTVDGEVDRCWAHVCVTADAVVARLRMTDEDDVRYMPAVSKRALAAAACADAGIAGAYRVEVVD